MKLNYSIIKYLPIFAVILFGTSCAVPPEITITNSIPDVEITDIEFGGRSLGCCLFTGESLTTTLSERRNDPNPTSRIYFVMRANGGELRLRTSETYQLLDGDIITVEIDRNTRVELTNQN